MIFKVELAATSRKKLSRVELLRKLTDTSDDHNVTTLHGRTKHRAVASDPRSLLVVLRFCVADAIEFGLQAAVVEGIVEVR